MHWNERVIRRRMFGPDGKPDGDAYAIHEVYYNDEDVPDSITEDPIEPLDDTVDELKKMLERWVRACELPVLDGDTLEEIP
jgi:hypothetical protein